MEYRSSYSIRDGNKESEFTMKIKNKQFTYRKKGDFEKLHLDAALLKKIVNDMKLHAGKLLPINHWHLVDKKEDTDDLAVPDISVADLYNDTMQEQYRNAERMLDAWIGCTGMQSLTDEEAEKNNHFLNEVDAIGIYHYIRQHAWETYDYRVRDLSTIAEMNLLYAGLKQAAEDSAYVLEVGGGYGRMAEAVMNVIAGVKYVMLDAVPGSILYSYEYLKQMLTDKKVGFYYLGDPFDLEQFDVYIIPAWHFERLNPYAYDCCINISSMQEMGQVHVDYYLELFDQVLKTGGMAYIQNSRDYVFQGEWRFQNSWKRIFMYNTPASWTDHYPTEIFIKEEADHSRWNRCIAAGYDYSLYEKQMLKNKISELQKEIERISAWGGVKQDTGKSSSEKNIHTVTVALLGKYNRKQIVYALNTVFEQSYPQIELVVSVCGADITENTVLDTLGAHHPCNLKSVRINGTCKEISEKEQLEYLCANMTGDRLIILSDGSCFYSKQDLENCADTNIYDQFVLGISVLYNKEDQYLGDIREDMSDTVESFLHKTLLQRGGIVLPGHFVMSDHFQDLRSLHDLEKMILKYVSEHAMYHLHVKNHTLLKCYETDIN